MIESSYVKLLKKIKLFAILALVLDIILFLVFGVFALVNSRLIIGLFQLLVSMYIMFQIKLAADKLLYSPLFSPVLVHYITKISYACFISGIGSTIIDTIIYSAQEGGLYLCFHLTTIGIGFLLYVGAYIFEYGCEMEDEYSLTV